MSDLQPTALSRRGQLVGLAVLGSAALLAVMIAFGLFSDDSNKRVSQTKTGVLGIEEAVATYKDIPQNGVLLGSSTAKARIIMFVDLYCPHCKEEFVNNQKKLVDTLVRSGKAQLELRLMALPQFGQNSQDARALAASAAESDSLWQFVQTAYYNQGLTADQQWLTPQLAENISQGLTSEGVKTSLRSSYDAVPQRVIAQADQLAVRLRPPGTPAFYVVPNSIKHPDSGQAQRIAPKPFEDLVTLLVAAVDKVAQP